MPAGTKAGKAEAAVKRWAEKKGLNGKRAVNGVMSRMASHPKPKRTVASY